MPWLTATTRFVPVGDGWVLTDAAGHTTARLVRDGVPPSTPQAVHTVPTISPFTRTQHTDSIAGAGVEAIKAKAAIGTWGLPGVAPTDASLSFTADGRWSAQTSCKVLGDPNGRAGAYRLLSSGFILATESRIAGVGCVEATKVIPAAGHAILDFYTAGSISIRGTRMTIYDRNGHDLGTLERKN